MAHEELHYYCPDPLWDRFKQGDREAFAQIYNTHIEGLLLYGTKILPDAQIVQDAIQDLFLELWRSRERLQSVQSVSLYLFKSLRYKLFRAGKIHMEYAVESIAGDALSEDPSIEAKILQREEEWFSRQKVRCAILQLPRRQQEAINLRFYQGFNNEQIAAIMDINYQSAANLIHKAILVLRKHL